MSIRQLALGTLCAASCLFGAACLGEADAQEPPLQQPPEEKAGAFCGGLAAVPCAEGYTCADDPTDSCDPANHGADCGGICVKEGEAPPPPECLEEYPRRHYVSRDPEQCAAIRFRCDPGYQPFFNDCGCGCELAP